jgi:hypothetical protein
MRLLDDHLRELYEKNIISYDVMMEASYDPKDLSEKIVKAPGKTPLPASRK